MANILKYDTKDEPINLYKTDFFKMKNKADEIAIFIKNNWDTLKINNSIAIKGAWGSGKSSIITTWESQRLFDESYEIIQIDAWKYEGDIDLKTSILQAMYSFSDKNTVGKAVSALIRYSKGIGDKFLDAASEKIKYDRVLESTKHSEYKEVERYISELERASKKKKIVIIDNIDRLSPQNLVLFLNSIKYLFSAFSNSNVIFVVLVDEKYMLHSFKEYLKLDEQKATEFTSKIFARTFEVIPRVNLDSFAEYSPANILIIKKYFKNNPRSIIKFFNIYDHIFGVDELKSTSAQINFKIYVIAMKLIFPIDAIKIFEPELNNVELMTNISFIYTNEGTEYKRTPANRFHLTLADKGKAIFSDNKAISYVVPSPNGKLEINAKPSKIIDLIDPATKNYIVKDFLNSYNFDLSEIEMREIVEQVIEKI